MHTSEDWFRVLIALSAAAHHQRLLSRELTHDPSNTPPPSEAEKMELVEGSLQSSTNEDAPPEYRDREYDWFVPGRLFRIYAPRDVEIHEKEFVLLDTKNKEGPGLLIRSYDEEEEKELTRGYGLRARVLVQNYDEPDERPPQSKKKVVYLDAYEDEDVEDRTWIELEHTYNIPFAKYKCVDCGVLERSSLQDLRRCYVDWLRYHWTLD